IGQGVPFTKPVAVYAGDYKDLDDAYLVIIAAGANQGPGETRMDLITKNAKIFGMIIPEIVKVNRECVLLVVTNPIDVLTTLTLRLSGFPHERVIGSGTVLDTARLKWLVGARLGVDSRNVHAFIIGEHGDSELAAWSCARVCGLPMEVYCRQTGCGKLPNQQSLYEEVKNAAYEIIKRKGATYYAIAMVVRRIAEALVRDEHSLLPVSSLVMGQYGLQGVCIGLPAIVCRKGVTGVIELPLDETEKQQLKASALLLETAYKTLA
ncbi:MAG: L-lactate dehydrogenase, partial [Kiritimatiellia bacterium]